MAAKFLGTADPREHEQAGRLDGSGAENGFLVGQDVMVLSANSQPNAGATSPPER